MRLRDLNAQFLRIDEYGPDGDAKVNEFVDSIDDAQGIMFQCPKCAEGKERGVEVEGGVERRFVRGAHHVICWFRNPRRLAPVGPAVKPGPGRWWIEGAGIDDLTFAAGTPPNANSVQLSGGCSWHGFITNGEATVI